MPMSTQNESSAGAHIVNCWNSIGVWGRERPRCPLLEQVIHCRNCEKYIAAGQRALERPLPQDYVQEWTRVLSREKDDENLAHLSVIVFRLGDEWFSLPVNYLEHVEMRRTIHTIPHGGLPLIKGLVNVAGEVKACFSLGKLLGIEKSVMHESMQRTAVYQGVVVLKKGKSSYVFPVTEVRELTRITLDQLKAIPATVPSAASGYLLGIFHYADLNIGHLDADLIIAGFERGVSS